ncbi:MBL fold metallo-hydrolase [Candidatus Poribacteria bacterium]|nr:MBL fold metallo-hydrolase [Candidatus Poribacteria bacterium]
METHYSQLSKHLYVHHGHVNTGILRDGNSALLIDPSGTSFQTTLTELGITTVEQILYTHHHRDSTAVFPIPENVRVGVPEAEAQWFTEVDTFWNDPKYRWHLYNCHPHNLMLANSINVTDTYAEGAQITWGPASIGVLETPGHTDGSVTYLIDVDEQRFAFSGDLIYDEGKIWDLYSLQKGQQTTDYHGFLGARDELKESLEKVRYSSPTVLVPTHGVVIKNPDTAIDKLIEQLDFCYDKYVSISALRHYFPQLFSEFEGNADHMPIREGKPPPEFLRHFGTTWLIISETGEAFVMDCGSPNVIKQIQQLQTDNEISEVTQFWVTHYHDDHVNAIPEFQETFPCETIADTVVTEVIENPKAFRLPCISPAVTCVDRATHDGDSWQWNEFTMTAYHFPGQTYYHGGLLVEGRGVRMFFSGDSFTMAGIDDYCSGNRNLLGKDVGYEKCLRLIQELKPTHIFNCHVDPAFDFTDKEIGFMLDTLAEREKFYTDLFPWDHANYGMDDQWVRCYPYEQEVALGKIATLKVEITNHSLESHTAIAQPILPTSWGIEIDPTETTIPPKADGHIPFSIPIPKVGSIFGSEISERIVIPVEITYNNIPLGQFREAIFVLTGG